MFAYIALFVSNCRCRVLVRLSLVASSRAAVVSTINRDAVSPIPTDTSLTPSAPQALGLHKQKVVITPCKPCSTATTNGTPRKGLNASYRPVSQSPLPEQAGKLKTQKIHQTNPRAICQFLCYDRAHPAVPLQPMETSQLPLATMETVAMALPPFSPGGHFHSAVMSTPLRSRMQPAMFAQTPSGRAHGCQAPLPSPLATVAASAAAATRPSPLATKPLPRSGIKYYNVRKSASLLLQADANDDEEEQGCCPHTVNAAMATGVTGHHMCSSLTRSNIELAGDLGSDHRDSSAVALPSVKRCESLLCRYESDDNTGGCGASDERAELLYRDANILCRSALMSPFQLHASRDLMPYACSPDLRDIPVRCSNCWLLIDWLIAWLLIDWLLVSCGYCRCA